MGGIKKIVFSIQQWRERPVVAISLITAVGAVFRIYHLGFKSLWLDEALLVQFANGNLEHVLGHNAFYNSYPPLFAILVHEIMAIGTSEWILRAIPCLAGIAAIPMIYLLSRNFISHRFAFFSAVLVALSPNQIMYSQQVVAYSLTFLFAEINLCLFLRFLGRVTWQNALFLGLIIFISIFLHYGLAVLVLSINILFVMRVINMEQPAKAIALWSVAQAMGLIAAFAVYHYSFKYQFTPGGFGADYLHPGYWDGTFHNLVSIAMFNTKDIFGFAFPMSYLMIILVILGVIWVTQVEIPIRSGSIMLLVMPFWVTFILAVVRLYPYVGARQTVYLSPMIYVFAAIGVSFLFSQRHMRSVGIVCIAVLMFQGGQNAIEYLRSEGTGNMRPVVRTLESLLRKDDLIYVYYGAQPAFEYYFRGHDHPFVRGVESRQAPEKYLQQLSEVLAQGRRVWIVISHSRYSEGDMIIRYVAGLREGGLVCREKGVYLFLAN